MFTLFYGYYIVIYLKYAIRSCSSSMYWKNIFNHLLNPSNANYIFIDSKKLVNDSLTLGHTIMSNFFIVNSI